jgi:hypothetical protein
MLKKTDYDSDIFDGAATLAEAFNGKTREDVVPMLTDFLSERGGKKWAIEAVKGIPEHDLRSLQDCVEDPEELEDYRGHMVNEGTYECIKEVLRPLYGY